MRFGMRESMYSLEDIRFYLEVEEPKTQGQFTMEATYKHGEYAPTEIVIVFKDREELKQFLDKLNEVYTGIPEYYLKPCPFCKGTPDIAHDRHCYGLDDYGEEYYIKCAECGTRTKSISDHTGMTTDEIRKELVNIWNRR